MVACLGLGALSLAGLSDTTVFPTRGQVLVLDAPWCNAGFTFQQGKLRGGEGGRRSYIIPRSNGSVDPFLVIGFLAAARSKFLFRGREVVVGGTREIDDWYSLQIDPLRPLG